MSRTSRRSWIAGALAVSALLGAGLIAAIGTAAPNEPTTPLPNPDLVAACGIDILVTLDESGSIASAGATEDVKRAFRAFTSALNNTGSTLAVSEFSTNARLPLPGAANRAYTTVTNATIASIFEPYIAGFDPDNKTNWEDAFRVDRYLLPRPNEVIPHLVVFITDGDPTAQVDWKDTTYDPGNPVIAQNEYELKVPLSSDETQDVSENPGTTRAVPNSNAIKFGGSHVLVIAVGEGLESQQSIDRIIAVSGPDVFRGTGTFDITTHDVYAEPDFSKLEDALRKAAFQLCAPSVNVRKLIDMNPDPAVEDLQPGANWSMTLNIDPSAPPPTSWVRPPTGSGRTATTTTGSDGFANFQWRTPTPANTGITVTETLQPGFVNDPSASTCTYRTPEQPTDRPLPGFSAAANTFSGTVPANSIVTCTMVNRVPAAPAVTIVKSTNGADANAPPGPFVTTGPGAQVTWTYLVRNTGNVPLTGITVDDVPPSGQPDPAVTCPATTLIPGEFMLCTATGTPITGQYGPNTGTVNATGAGIPVTASDPSHYFGITPGIDIEKFTNITFDADLPPGPPLTVGSTVTWTYVVTNTGNAPLTGIAVTDNRIGAVTCPATTLAVGASMTCTATGTVVAGQYVNIGSVTANGGLGDSDPSHHFGSAPAVTIEKFTNSDTADVAPGPQLLVGGPVIWRYVVTNTGNVPLFNWVVTDSQPGVGVACPRIGSIAVGQTVTCFASGTVTAGQYTNTGTVTANTAFTGVTVTANDPANYFGLQGGIQLVKRTNGFDANAPLGPIIPLGDPVTWTYDVTNTGNALLSNVAVQDDHAVVVTCPATTLAAGASMTCSAAGTALPDQYANSAVARGVTPVGQQVRDTDPSHYFGANPGVQITKYTNGDDANTAPGPLIAVGDPVEWTYDVVNTGNTPLTGVTVTDDRGVAVSCPQTVLAPGAEMACTATGTAQRGQYANVGTVTTASGLTDSDPSHYFGVDSQIHVEKLTNGQDADNPPGPSIPVGGAVTWTYRITNPGNVPILHVTVTDNRGVVPTFVSGDADGDERLDPSETWVYTASGTAETGQYSNVATARGLDVVEEPVSDTDPSHYNAPSSPTPPSPPTPPPGPQPPTPPGTSTVVVIKRWVGERAPVTIFVDRNGGRPYDAVTVARANGDSARATVPVSTPVTVGEIRLPQDATATINCGTGARTYTGGPFDVLSPATPGGVVTCTIVNRVPVEPPAPRPRPRPRPVIVVAKSAQRTTLRMGQTGDFVITVRNNGPGMARNVRVCDELPDGLVFSRARGARLVQGDACWRILRLRAGQTRRFVARVRPVRVSRVVVIANVVTVTAPNGSLRACMTRSTASAKRKSATTCTARAVIRVLPARARGDGVTG